MPEKLPYKLTIKLSSARPDAIGEALAQLRQMMSDYDQSGEAAATVTLESYKEAGLNEIRSMFELWLYSYKIGLECEITKKEPGLRPETVVALRATKATPMDKAGWEEDDEDEPTKEDDERAAAHDAISAWDNWTDIEAKQ